MLPEQSQWSMGQLVHRLRECFWTGQLMGSFDASGMLDHSAFPLTADELLASQLASSKGGVVL